MYEVSIKSDFKAAHELKFQGGKCESLHGHNWTVEVVVESENLNEWGAVIDFHLLKSELDVVLKPFDHARLNFIPPFDKQNPTAENLAGFIAGKLSERPEIRKACRLKRVRVSETSGMSATFTA